MGAAEIQHLLGLPDAADERAGHGLAPQDHGGGVQGRFQAAQVADQHQGAVQRQGGQVRVQIVGIGHGVDDEIEAALHGGHGRRVGGQDHLVGAQAPGVLLLAGGAGQQGDIGAQGLGQLQGHVAEAAQADHRHMAARARVPVRQGRPGGDPGAQQRRGTLQVQAVRDVQDERGGHHDLFGVAALGLAVVVAVDPAVGEGGAFFAVLLQAPFAGGALLAGIDHAADTDPVPGPEAGDGRAHLDHPADHLVAGHDRVGSPAPVVAGGVQIRVADPAVQDLDHHVVGPRVAALEAEGGQAFFGGLRGVANHVRGHGALLAGWGVLGRGRRPLGPRGDVLQCRNHPPGRVA